MSKKITTHQLAAASILLALSISSVFLKGISIYITGPIVNLVLIICTLYCGTASALLIGLVTPIFSAIIGASPIVAAVPQITPFIIIGNELLVISIPLVKKAIISLKFNLPTNPYKKEYALLAPSIVIGAILKSLFMSITIVRFILPTFGTALPEKAIAIANVSFSISQLIVALIGGFLACLIWPIIKKATRKFNECQ